MANEPHPELVIIKRHGGHEDGHHGGAWKIAFADFMTAMMALFLVLWLISATTPKMRIVIARYFNPIKLADVSAENRGLNDPVAGGKSSRAALKTEVAKEKRLELPPLPEKRALFDVGAPAAHDEAALFRDPYAVLSEIAAEAGEGGKTQSHEGEGTGPKSGAAMTADSNDAFRDPFTTIPQEDKQQAVSNPNAAASAKGPAKQDNLSETQTVSEEQKAASNVMAGTSGSNPDQSAFSAPANPAKESDALSKEMMTKPATETPAVKTPDAGQAANPPSPTAVKEKAAPPAKDAAKIQNQTKAAADQPLSQQAAAELHAQLALADTRANEAEAGRLQAEVAVALHKEAVSQGAPNVEVKSTPEGVLISLTDEANYAMFAVGSSEPQQKTIEAMEKVAQLLKNHPGLIVVRGHTDGRPYKSGAYDNWQLSAARAQMAHYMLVRGGLDEKRIERIEGYADHRLKIATDPLAAENRRIEILLRKDRP
jgi:chemotaxis protein MotB